jgi:hypothetical protein
LAVTVACKSATVFDRELKLALNCAKAEVMEIMEDCKVATVACKTERALSLFTRLLVSAETLCEMVVSTDVARVTSAVIEDRTVESELDWSVKELDRLLIELWICFNVTLEEPVVNVMSLPSTTCRTCGERQTAVVTERMRKEAMRGITREQTLAEITNRRRINNWLTLCSTVLT